MHRSLALKRVTPVAVGKQRYVFVHPLDPDLVIKVPTESYVRRRAGVGGKWYKKGHKKYLRSRHFLVFLRELREHLAVHAATGEIPPHMQTIVGFEQTDIGMGLVSRAVRGRDGELAPTLSTLLREGRFDAAARRKLDEFFDWLVDSPVIVGDLNVGNIVYGHTRELGDHFVVIDGLGDKNLIPLNSLSGTLNRWAKQRRIRRLNRHIARFAAPASDAPASEQAIRVAATPSR